VRSAKPEKIAKPGASASAKSTLEAAAFADTILAKALSNPLRLRIIDVLSNRVMSASQFARAYPQYTYNQVHKQFRKLIEYDLLELVEEKTGGRRRSAVERFYRAKARSIFSQKSWARIPPQLRTGVTANTFATYTDRVAEAMDAGTIDSRTDRHFTWSDPELDEQAWLETIGDIEELFRLLPIRQAESAQRLALSGGEPIPTTIGLTCFVSPPEEASDPE